MQRPRAVIRSCAAAGSGPTAIASRSRIWGILSGSMMGCCQSPRARMTNWGPGHVPGPQLAPLMSVLLIVLSAWRLCECTSCCRPFRSSCIRILEGLARRGRGTRTGLVAVADLCECASCCRPFRSSCVRIREGLARRGRGAGTCLSRALFHCDHPLPASLIGSARSFSVRSTVQPSRTMVSAGGFGLDAKSFGRSMGRSAWSVAFETFVRRGSCASRSPIGLS